MPEEQRNYGDQRNCGCGGNGCGGNGCCGNGLSGLFGGCGCGGNSEILFFLIIFLLLFTNYGCCNN